MADLPTVVDEERDSLQPFLKWPGGKRWFVAQHVDLLPRKYGRYIEPFLGSGSVFFHLRPKRATLSDSNAELIAAFRAIKADWKGVARLLGRHQRNHDARHYYRVRGSSPRSAASIAARLVYLNRTCFNGIYRVNRDGEFNVPIGNRDSVQRDADRFDAISKALRRARLVTADFATTISEARQGDLLFADPPYTVRHNHNAFIKYNEQLFSWQDQVRLADALAEARDRGVHVVCTNANHRSVRALYRERGFKLKTVWRSSNVSADASCRKQFDELVILSHRNGSPQ